MSPAVDITDGESNRLIGTCMIDEGLDVAIIEDEAALEWKAESPEEGARYDEAYEVCEALLIDQGLLPAKKTSWSDEQLAAEYDRLLEMASCISEAGYPVPDPPSLEVFVEGDGNNWHPYSGLGSLSEADFAAINVDCPQDMGS